MYVYVHPLKLRSLLHKVRPYQLVNLVSEKENPALLIGKLEE